MLEPTLWSRRKSLATGLVLAAVATCFWMFPKSCPRSHHSCLTTKPHNDEIRNNEPHFSTASYLYVGSLDNGLPAMSKYHVIDQDFRFWVAGGIVATDFAIAPLKDWDPTTTTAGSSTRGGADSRRKLTTPHGSSDVGVSISLALSTLLERVQLLEDQVRKQEARIVSLTAGGC